MFANLNNKRSLENATSAQDDPAPVYLLEEIWALVQGSPGEVPGVVSYINKRLTHRSPVVKQKTLRLIKYLCAKGSSEFKRSMSKHGSAVRELTRFKGEADTFKGDVPNQRVRDMAKEAMDAMFAATNAAANAAVPLPSMQSRIQGFGSTASSAGDAHKAASASSFTPPSLGVGGSPGGRLSLKGFGPARGGPAAWKPSANGAEKSGGGSQSPGGALSPKALAHFARTLSGNLVGKARIDSAASLFGEDKSAHSSEDEGGGGGLGIAAPAGPSRYGPSVAVGAAAAADARRASGAASSGGVEEERLVDGICAGGGLRATPAADALRVFVESAAALDGATLARLLEHKLARPGAICFPAYLQMLCTPFANKGERAWQVVLRALCALGAVIQQGSCASCGQIAVHFQADASAVRAVAASPHASVRQQAGSVLALLGAAPAATAASSSRAPAAAAPPAPDLLGDLMGSKDPSAAPPAAADLLGDLMTHEAGSGQGSAAAALPMPGAGPPPANDLFGIAAPAVGNSQGIGELFGGLSVAGPSPPPAAPPTPAQHGPLSDVTAPSPAPAPATATTGGLFGGLTMALGPQPALQNGAWAPSARAPAHSGLPDDGLLDSLGCPSQAPPLANGLASLMGPPMPAQGQHMLWGAQQPQTMQGAPPSSGFPAQQLAGPGGIAAPAQHLHWPQAHQMQHVQQMQQMQQALLMQQQMGLGGGLPGAAGHLGAFPLRPYGQLELAPQQFAQPPAAPHGQSWSASQADLRTGPEPAKPLGGAAQPVKDVSFDFVGDHVKGMRHR